MSEPSPTANKRVQPTQRRKKQILANSVYMQVASPRETYGSLSYLKGADFLATPSRLTYILLRIFTIYQSLVLVFLFDNGQEPNACVAPSARSDAQLRESLWLRIRDLLRQHCHVCHGHLVLNRSFMHAWAHSGSTGS